MRPDTTLDALSSGCAWFGRSLRSGKQHEFPVLGATGVFPDADRLHLCLSGIKGAEGLKIGQVSKQQE